MVVEITEQKKIDAVWSSQEMEEGTIPKIVTERKSGRSRQRGTQG